MIHDLVVLVCMLAFGYYYYRLSTSYVKETRNKAFVSKIFLLIISFVLAFIENDYLIVGESLVVGGRAPIMMLILIEIVDAFIDRKNKQ